MSDIPPPPPPGAPSASAPFSVGNAVSYGWNAYWRNVAPMVLFALVILVVNLVLNLIAGSFDSVAGQLIFQVLMIIVGAILAMGLIRASLAITEGRKPELNMLLVTDGLWSYVVATIVFTIALAVGLFLLVVPGLIVLVMWHLFGYVIVETPNTGPIDALQRSAEITKGHRWELFGLLIVLLLINIVGVLACLIGLIFTYGISAVTVAYAYKTLSGQPVAGP